jgi:hypothetical protein
LTWASEFTIAACGAAQLAGALPHAALSFSLSTDLDVNDAF